MKEDFFFFKKNRWNDFMGAVYDAKRNVASHQPRRLKTKTKGSKTGRVEKCANISCPVKRFGEDALRFELEFEAVSTSCSWTSLSCSWVWRLQVVS